MVRITLRIIESVHEALVKSAKKNHRSLNSEIMHALIEYAKSQGYKIVEE